MSNRGLQLRRSSTNVSDPCKLRILVVPVGPITRQQFRKHFRQLHEFAEIHIDQLISQCRTNPDLPRFERKLFKLGRVHLSFVTEFDKSHQPFEQFQLFRRVIGVVGIIDCEQCTNLPEAYQSFLTFREKLPHVVGQRCFAFNATSGIRLDEDGVTSIAEGADMGTYIQIAMLDLISQLVISCCEQADQILKGDPSLTQGVLPPPSPNTSPNLPISHTSSHSLSSIPPPNPNSNHHRRTISFQRDFSTRVLNLASSVGLGTEQRTKRQYQGRQLKQVADLFLMAGRFPEAAKMYLKAIDVTRSNADHLAYIFSLEGYYCTILLIISINVDPAEFSYKGDPEEFLMTIVDSYLKELIKLYEDTPHPLLYIEAYLKLAKLLTIIWKLGTGRPAIEACINDDFDTSETTPVASLPGNRRRVTRADVTSWTMSAFNPATEYLSMSDRVCVFSTMAAIFGTLGYHRKEAFFLRHSSLLLFPTLMQNNLHRDHQLLTENEETIQRCLDRIYLGYAIDPTPIVALDPSYCELRHIGVTPHHNGWVRLQRTVLLEGIAMAEAFSDYPSMQSYLIQMLFRFYPYLTKGEQEEALQSLRYIVQCMLNSPPTLQDLPLNTWVAFPDLLKINGFKIDPALSLAEKPNNESSLVNSGLKRADRSSSNDNTPFMLHFKKTDNNPGSNSTLNPEGSQDDLAWLVMGENSSQLELLITNPFRIQLEITHIQFKFVECETLSGEFAVEWLDQTKAGWVIPPKAQRQAVRLRIRPLKLGRFQVQKIQLGLFYATLHDVDLTPRCGQLAGEVLVPLPQLKVVGASLPQPSLMLYEGETTRFSLKLHNVMAQLPVTYLNIKFNESDSNSSQIRPSTNLMIWLNPNPLNPEVSDQMIEGGGHRTLNFQIRGKPNIAFCSILIDYGLAECPVIRQKSYLMNLTIVPCVVPLDVDIHPQLPPLVLTRLKLGTMYSHCCLILSYRNPHPTSPVKLNISIQSDPQLTPWHETIPPQAWHRIFVPFPKYRLTIAPPSKLLASNRLTDWIGQQLLTNLKDKLKITWSMCNEATSTTREGLLSHDWVHLASHHLAYLQQDPIEIKTRLIMEDGQPMCVGKVIRLEVQVTSFYARWWCRPLLRCQPYLDHHNGQVQSLIQVGKPIESPLSTTPPPSTNMGRRRASSSLSNSNHHIAVRQSKSQLQSTSPATELDMASHSPPVVILSSNPVLLPPLGPNGSTQLRYFDCLLVSVGTVRIGISCQPQSHPPPPGEVDQTQDSQPDLFDPPSSALYFDPHPVILAIESPAPS